MMANGLAWDILRANTRAATMKLSAVIGVEEWEKFRDAFQRRISCVHAVTGSPERFQSLWSEWELEAACQFTPVSQDEHFRLLIRGKKVPPNAFTDRMGQFRQEAFRALRGSGASVAFGHFEDFSDRALALSRALEAEFRLPVQINLYVTPAGNQGLGAHVDPHDVLILQIHGEKSWDIYDGQTADRPPFETTLKQGGWLFLPKGTRHEVRNRGSAASVHFTVGFHPLTWGEIFQRALNRARVATSELNEPLAFDAVPDAAPEAIERRLQSIVPFVDVPEFLASYYAGFPALMVQVPLAGVVERDALEAADETAIFRWCEEAVLAEKGDSNPQVALPYRRFPIELRHEFSVVLAWMRQAVTFGVKQPPMDDARAALLLCKFLAGLGVLRIRSSA